MRSYDFAELVYRKVESDELDYKSAMSWRTMTRQEKGKIVRHLTAFANTRGGFLVIGVSEDVSGVPSLYTGVSEEQAGSFDPTPVGDFINAHIEPALDYTIERPLIDGKRYVIFVVKPFKQLPHVCSRGVENELQEGIFYIRTAEASSRPARRAHEMQELLRRCMRNEREQLGRILRGILYETRQSAAGEKSRLSDQILDAERYFRHRRNRNGICLKFAMYPDRSLHSASTPADLHEAVKKSVFPCSKPEFLSQNAAAGGQAANGSVRFLSVEQPLMWQFFDNGLFCFFRDVENNRITLENLARFCAESTRFAGKLAQNLNLSEELLTLKISLSPADEAVIEPDYRTGEKEVAAEIRRSAADLISGQEQHAARLLRRIGEQFQLPDKQLDHFHSAISTFLECR